MVNTFLNPLRAIPLCCTAKALSSKQLMMIAVTSDVADPPESSDCGTRILPTNPIAYRKRCQERQVADTAIDCKKRLSSFGGSSLWKTGGAEGILPDERLRTGQREVYIIWCSSHTSDKSGFLCCGQLP